MIQNGADRDDEKVVAETSAAQSRPQAVPTTALEDGRGPGGNVNSRDQDIAIAIVGERSQAIDPAVEARVVRKIDLFLVPAMIVGYGLVYYDKVCAVL